MTNTHHNHQTGNAFRDEHLEDEYEPGLRPSKAKAKTKPQLRTVLPVPPLNEHFITDKYFSSLERNTQWLNLRHYDCTKLSLSGLKTLKNAFTQITSIDFSQSQREQLGEERFTALREIAPQAQFHLYRQDDTVPCEHIAAFNSSRIADNASEQPGSADFEPRVLPSPSSLSNGKAKPSSATKPSDLNVAVPTPLPYRDEQFVTIFKQIYTALYEGDSGFFKAKKIDLTAVTTRVQLEDLLGKTTNSHLIKARTFTENYTTSTEPLLNRKAALFREVRVETLKKSHHCSFFKFQGESVFNSSHLAAAMKKAAPETVFESTYASSSRTGKIIAALNIIFNQDNAQLALQTQQNPHFDEQPGMTMKR